MTEGRAKPPSFFLAGLLAAAATVAILADAVKPSSLEPEPGPFIDKFARCVPDGFCAPIPGTLCPADAWEGMECERCQYQRFKERCKLYLLSNCAWFEHQGFESDCGQRVLGQCQGPNMPCIEYQGHSWGTCNRVTCTD